MATSPLTQPIVETIAALILIVGIGMTFVPYVILGRGSVWRYLATLGSLVPLMIYLSVSNAPSILKTVFGASETWKRTPKTRRFWTFCRLLTAAQRGRRIFRVELVTGRLSSRSFNAPLVAMAST